MFQSIKPQIPGYEGSIINFGEGQPEYIPLPAIVHRVEGMIAITSCWQPNDDEQARIAAGDPIFLTVMHSEAIIAEGICPVRLGLEIPEELARKDEAQHES